jgi:hypothetical protein
MEERDIRIGVRLEYEPLTRALFSATAETQAATGSTCWRLLQGLSNSREWRAASQKGRPADGYQARAENNLRHRDNSSARHRGLTEPAGYVSRR